MFKIKQNGNESQISRTSYICASSFIKIWLFYNWKQLNVVRAGREWKHKRLRQSTNRVSCFELNLTWKSKAMNSFYEWNFPIFIQWLSEASTKGKLHINQCRDCASVTDKIESEFLLFHFDFAFVYCRWSEQQCLVHHMRSHYCHVICWYYHYFSSRNYQVSCCLILTSCLPFSLNYSSVQFSNDTVSWPLSDANASRVHSKNIRRLLISSCSSLLMFIGIGSWIEAFYVISNWPPGAIML